MFEEGHTTVQGFGQGFFYTSYTNPFPSVNRRFPILSISADLSPILQILLEDMVRHPESN